MTEGFAMKEFSSAAIRAANQEDEDWEPLPFKVDDDEFTAYPPTPAQFALFMAAQSSHADMTDQVAGLLDFFDGLLSKEDQVVFRKRLLDRDDTLDLDTVMELVEWFVEEWSARPTKPPSDSPSSQARTGRKSTAKPRSKASTS